LKSFLLYYSSSQISIDLISLILELRNNSFRVYFLSHCEKGNLQLYLEKQGIKVESIKKIGYLKKIYHLIYYCNKNKIDVVNSHTQVNNFILSIAQFFIKAKCIMTRHHSDYVYNGNNRMAKLFDKIINKLSKNIIAISDKVKDQMINIEGVNPNKVFRVNNGYNFDLYNNFDPKFNLNLEPYFTLINIGRFIPLKRQLLLLKAFKNIIHQGYNFKLILVGDGEQKGVLKNFVIENNLQENVIFTGHINNVLDYINISDLLVHTSESEASSTVVKEAGVFNVPSLVCDNVGDFNEYLNSNNSYKIPKEINPLELTNKLIQIYIDKMGLKEKAKIIKIDIKKRFSIENTIKYFLKTIKN
jgi:hypothetical protein